MNTFIKQFDNKFNDLHNSSCTLINSIPTDKLFWKLTETYSIFSCGEFILRSAAKVEQTFGGITSRLWDDPFEWTLPEELSTNKKILDYLNEVEETRLKGFAFLKSDNDLKKRILAPDKMKTLFEVLLETLIEAEQLQGRAAVICQLSTSVKL